MSPDVPVLAIEASQRVQSVALGHAGWLEQEPIESDRRDREDLLPAIERLCRRRNVRPREIAAVIVDGGPGGFTGLRMAHAAAQAMSVAMGIPVVQACAAVVAREVARRQELLAAGQATWVALACKGEEAWVARVDPVTDPDMALDARSCAAEAWDRAGVDRLIADEHLPASWVRACDRHGIRRLPLGLDAAALLTVGLRMLSQGRVTPPQALVPLYPREAEAVRLWRVRHGGGADGIRCP
jgi:tRNA threonylcarbamoyl adenosine modification protein YeaZ